MEVYPNAGGETTGMYMASDSREENIYALAACSVIGMGTRVYLVDLDRDDPIGRLVSNQLKDSIVGGSVADCQVVFLTSNTHGLTIA
jgi:hypothetical protein